MKKQKIIFFTLGFLAGIVIGASGMAIAKHSNTTPVVDETTITLEGKVICLTHKNTDGPQTLECASGLQATNNKTYALSSSQPLTEISAAAGSDKTVRINGTLQPDKSIYTTDGKVVVSSYEFVQK